MSALAEEVKLTTEIIAAKLAAAQENSVDSKETYTKFKASILQLGISEQDFYTQCRTQLNAINKTMENEKKEGAEFIILDEGLFYLDPHTAEINPLNIGQVVQKRQLVDMSDFVNQISNFAITQGPEAAAAVVMHLTAQPSTVTEPGQTTVSPTVLYQFPGSNAAPASTFAVTTVTHAPAIPDAAPVVSNNGGAGSGKNSSKPSSGCK